MIYVFGALTIALSALSLYLYLRKPTEPQSPQAQKEIVTAGEIARNKAQAEAQAILKAPSSELEARVAELRAKGRK